jgi:hypothetical protein
MAAPLKKQISCYVSLQEWKNLQLVSARRGTSSCQMVLDALGPWLKEIAAEAANLPEESDDDE